MAETPTSASSSLITHHSPILSQFFGSVLMAVKLPWPRSLRAQMGLTYGCRCVRARYCNDVLRQRYCRFNRRVFRSVGRSCSEHKFGRSPECLGPQCCWRIRSGTAPPSGPMIARRNRFGPCRSQRRRVQQQAAQTLKEVAPYPNCASDGTTLGLSPVGQVHRVSAGFLRQLLKDGCPDLPDRQCGAVHFRVSLIFVGPDAAVARVSVCV